MGGGNRRSRKGPKKNSPKKNVDLLVNELSQLKLTKKGSKAKRDEKILDEEKKIRKRRHSNTTKMDILLELDQRGLLSFTTKQILKNLDLISLSNCGSVSSNWRRMVQELPISKQNELKWINSLLPKEKLSIDPKAVTGTDEFDIWGLSKIHSDQDGNIFVSGGVQVWCYWPDYTFRRHILLEAGEVILLKVFGDKMIVFTDYFHILIYSLDTGELLKNGPTIPDAFVERWHERKIEIPRVCSYFGNEFYIMTNRQIGAWKIDLNQMEENSIDWKYRPICALDQPFGKLGFSHGFCFCKNNILAAVGGSKVINRARSRSESARQRNQTNFGYIKEYTMEGVFVRDIGNNYATEHKATIRQTEYKNGFIYSLGHEDYLKIWNYQTGELFRTIPIANKGCHSKFILTQSLLICSIYGGLEFHDLRLMCLIESDRTLIRRMEDFEHDMVDFIFQNDRILVAERKMWIYKLKPTEPGCFVTGPDMTNPALTPNPNLNSLSSDQHKHPKTDNFPEEIRFISD